MSVPCSSCQAPIIWVKTPRGRSMPLDAAPNPEGNMVIENGVAVVLTIQRLADPATSRRRFMAHWATCPNAKSHRSKAKR